MPENNDFENDSAVYKTLLESTRAIPWKIDWPTMRFAYIGPQIEPLLGWRQASWVSANDWASRIHPEDRERVVNFCIAQSQAGVDHEADYRALTQDNGYVWIRDVVHVVRNDAGEVESLVGFMFDISERKKTEEKLLALQKELEALSFKDGLTGIANRRQFDACLAREWESARSNQRPLSLVLVDVDFFKQYNDLYGHLQGDTCLTTLAQTLSLALVGPRDLVARYGGEEFILVLPDTDLAGAQRVAEKLSERLRTESFEAQGQRFSVTQSVGVAEVVQGDAVWALRVADRNLYQAKQAGRDRMVASVAFAEDAASGSNTERRLRP